MKRLIALYKYFSTVPTLPKILPSFSEKELERTNADVKQALEGKQLTDACMAILPPRSASMYPCRREVLKHSFHLSVPLQRKIIDTSIDNERTAAGKWVRHFGYVLHDVISRKIADQSAKFSGYTV